MKKGSETVRGPSRQLRLWAMLAATVIVLSLAAEALALPRVRQYVGVTVTPLHLDLGSVPQPGTYDSPASLSVHVAANCNHGAVLVSASPLTKPGGASIPANRVFVKQPATGDYVPLNNPVPVTAPTGPGIFDVVLNFRVETVLEDPPGSYTGTLVITCTAGP